MIDSRSGVFQDSMGQSHSRCSYPNGYNYGPRGKLHTTWVWRESSQGSNHDLIYVYSEDRGNTWFNNNGEKLSETPHVNSPGITVVEISRELGLMNTHGQAVDSKGRIHTVMWHCTDELLRKTGSKPGEHRWGVAEARRYHHYWRDQNAIWHHNELPGNSGNRPKVFIDEEDNAYLIYSDAKRRETDPSGGNLVIMAASAKSAWKDWKVIHVEQGPFVNEMLGDYYRWQQEKILSVMVQEMAGKPHDPTRLRILDFNLNNYLRREQR